MKKLFYIFILIANIAFAQSGDSADRLFAEANDLYRKEQFEAAAKKYESVIKNAGMQSAELHFNLGNSYYKLDRIAPAVFHYEKALLLNPDDADIRNNLGFAHKMMIDEVVATPEAGFGEIIGRFTSAFSYNCWSWIAVAFSFLFLALFAGYYLSAITLYKRVFFVSMIIAIAAMAISILSAIYENARYKNERPAIIFDSITSVKSEPKDSSSDGLTLHEGTKVYVMEELDSWRRVRLPNGSDGWIESSAIRELK